MRGKATPLPTPYRMIGRCGRVPPVMYVVRYNYLAGAPCPRRTLGPPRSLSITHVCMEADMQWRVVALTACLRLQRRGDELRCKCESEGKS